MYMKDFRLILYTYFYVLSITVLVFFVHTWYKFSNNIPEFLSKEVEF